MQAEVKWAQGSLADQWDQVPEAAPLVFQEWIEGGIEKPELLPLSSAFVPL